MIGARCPWFTGVGLCCLVLSCERQTPDPSPPVAAARAKHPPLDYAFTNELGQPVTLGQFRGKALALTFIFTRCPNSDYCPRLSKNFQEAAEKLRATPGAPTNWHFLSVTLPSTIPRLCSGPMPSVTITTRLTGVF